MYSADTEFNRRDYLDENELLMIVANHSPEGFHELRISFPSSVKTFSQESEPIFTSWANRTPQKSLSLIILDRFEVKRENMETIEKFKRLGVIKQFIYLDISDEIYYSDPERGSLRIVYPFERK